MKKIVLCLIVLSAFALKGQSQNEPNVVDQQSGSKKACFKLASLSISSDVNDFPTMNHLDKGFGMGQPSKGMNNMFPGNTDFMKGNHAGDMNSRKQLNLEMGFNPYSKKLGGYNKQREFDIGLTYSGSNLKDKNSNKFTSTPGDCQGWELSGSVAPRSPRRHARRNETRSVRNRATAPGSAPASCPCRASIPARVLT